MSAYNEDHRLPEPDSEIINDGVAIAEYPKVNTWFFEGLVQRLRRISGVRVDWCARPDCYAVKCMPKDVEHLSQFLLDCIGEPLARDAEQRRRMAQTDKE